jgi:hypothetical protein
MFMVVYRSYWEHYASRERHYIGCETRQYDDQYLSLHQNKLEQLNTVDLS